MDWTQILSLILNLVFGGGFIVTIVTLRSERKKADEAAKAAQLDNIEKATDILMQNIVAPLKSELNEVRKEIKRLRRAINEAKNCEHSATCPILRKLQASSSDTDAEQ